MTPPVFLVAPDRLAGVAAGDALRLDGPEGRHAATVRRLQPGEQLVVGDGTGRSAACVVRAAERDALALEVTGVSDEPAPQPRLVAVQALPKGDRAELAVEVMTEVGVDVVVPWAAARCVTQWRGDRGEKALARWRSAAREAGKQARRARLPEVLPLATTAQVGRLLAEATLGVVLHEEATRPLATAEVPADGDVVVVVGPEGGITAEELAVLEGAGAAAYRLGPTVLRTSTAGVAALAVLAARSGRWG